MSARNSDAYKLIDAQTIDAYEMMGAQKTDAYKPMGAQSVRVFKSEKSCVQNEKVQNPCVLNSSCVGVWKNDGVEIIHNNQRKPACQDADVKPIVRDPMDDDRVLVESGAEMTLVPHKPPSSKTETSSHSHPMSAMVHIMRQRQSTSGTTQTNRTHYRRQRTPSDTM